MEKKWLVMPNGFKHIPCGTLIIEIGEHSAKVYGYKDGMRTEHPIAIALRDKICD